MIGVRAEELRREMALEWFGKEMAAWGQPCRLSVAVNMQSPSGQTEFTFAFDRVAGMAMKVRGPLDRLAFSVLPHEVMHALLAHHFNQPVPRWVDEGIAIRAEDATERERHDAQLRRFAKQSKLLPLATLFSLKDYPFGSDNILCLYAQGYSVTDFLLRSKDRATLLAFVDEGLKSGWTKAVKSCYGHESVEELEEAWLKDLREIERAKGAAGAVEVHCNDGSIVKGILKEEKIELATPYGKLLIPVSDIHKIDLGVRPTAEEYNRIDAAIKDLGQADAKRQAAADALLALKEKAYPALILAAKNKDAVVARQAVEVLKNLRTRIPEDTLEAGTLDVIHTARSKISGRLQAKTLRLSTTVFGEQEMRLAGVHSVRSLAYVAEKSVQSNPPPAAPAFPPAKEAPEPPSIRQP
jgi:hypothetical protein